MAKRRRLSIGSVELIRSEPLVIASFTQQAALAGLRAAARRGLALAEARVDLFEGVDPSEIVALVERARKIVPVLATVRSASEGGGWKRPENERLELYRTLGPHVDALDIELDAPIRKSVVEVARKARCTLVLSHHDFGGTPAPGALDHIVLRSSRAGADVTKIATLVRNADDLVTLTGVLTRHRDRDLVVIGMGERGKLTRVLFPALGSLFTFASLDRPTAPGQLDIEETLREVARYSGGPLRTEAGRRRRSGPSK